MVNYGNPVLEDSTSHATAYHTYLPLAINAFNSSVFKDRLVKLHVDVWVWVSCEDLALRTALVPPLQEQRALSRPVPINRCSRSNIKLQRNGTLFYLSSQHSENAWPLLSSQQIFLDNEGLNLGLI